MYICIHINIYIYTHVYTGDRRYPVYPGHEAFDPLDGPNSRQEFINKEGILYSFPEGQPRLWPRLVLFWA